MIRNSDIIEIHIKLLDEGTDCWRPVRAQRLGENKYKIIGIDNYDSDNEKWEFLPGDIVCCAEKEFSDGKKGMVAIEKL